ncbi:MAG: hypothetical protein PHS82_07215 [Lachnospiraceae bacterium]|nr:hypothetical protein [Lachnospiraceae bacterium]
MSDQYTRQEIQERLLKSYQPYFDINPCDESEQPLVARCGFHVKSSKYVLVKKAELWKTEGNEHLFLFSMPRLTAELFEQCKNLAYEEGMKLIDPKPGHMYTYITTVFICDECDDAARTALKKCRIHKSFQFSLRGWMDFHTGLIDLKSNTTLTNQSGKCNADFLKKILQV